MGSPLVVVVSGAPGSGKSTLAGRLATALALPVLMKDELKEALYEAISPEYISDVPYNALLGQTAYALLYVVARRLIVANVGVILESNFYRGYSERELTPVLAGTRSVQVHCGGDAAVIVSRYRERFERGERHAGHDDMAAIPRLRDALATGRCEPLDLPLPTLRVDTTLSSDVTSYAPSFDDILAFIAIHA